LSNGGIWYGSLLLTRRGLSFVDVAAADAFVVGLGEGVAACIGVARSVNAILEVSRAANTVRQEREGSDRFGISIIGEPSFAEVAQRA
jgi:hypothetical protein